MKDPNELERLLTQWLGSQELKIKFADRTFVLDKNLAANFIATRLYTTFNEFVHKCCIIGTIGKKNTDA
jgi:hypothetical protein